MPDKKLLYAMNLFNIVQKSDTKQGKIFDAVVIALILYSIFTLTIETLPSLDNRLVTFLGISEIVITVLFTIEYMLRLISSEKKLGYVFSIYGLIDLIAILPFYLSLGLDLRALRAFRIFRIFRLLKLTRYSRAINRFHRALILAKEELVLFLVATLILLYLAAFGIYHFENEVQPESFKSIIHSIWWATTSLTTVGYGDVYPITAGGRFFTFFVLVIGLGVVAVPPGLVASSLSKARDEEKFDI